MRVFVIALTLALVPICAQAQSRYYRHQPSAPAISPAQNDFNIEAARRLTDLEAKVEDLTTKLRAIRKDLEDRPTSLVPPPVK